MDQLKNVKITRFDQPKPAKKWKAVLLFVAIFIGWIALMNYLNWYMQPRVAVTHASSKGLEYELALDKLVYGLGEPINIRLVVRNTSPKEVLLHFTSSQHYSFSVKRDIDYFFFHYPSDVWKSSFGKAIDATPNTLTLKPGEIQSFQEAWNQKDVNGKQVLPGHFVILGQLTHVGGTTLLQIPARMKR